jgi:predicted ATPase
LTQDLIGKLFGDRRYVSQVLFEEFYEQGLQLITKAKKNRKQRLVKLIDKILLRKRVVIESVNDPLQNISQIEHSRHRSEFNFPVNLIAGLTAYPYQPKKSFLDVEVKGLPALPLALL